MAGELALLLPAAGASARMRGGDKLLEPLAGEAILRRQAKCAARTGLPVAVTLATDARARMRRSVLDGLGGVTILEVPDAAAGMSASLRAGAAWAAGLEANALMIVLPDMPEITHADISTLARAFADDPSRPLRAASEAGVPGHPVILPAEFFAEMMTLSGDQGARDLLRAHPASLVLLEGNRATTDLDTPEEWDAWRARAPH